MDPPPTVFSHSFDLLIPLKQPAKRTSNRTVFYNCTLSPMKYQMRQCETRSRNSSAHHNSVLEEGRAEMRNNNVQVCVTHKTIFGGSWFLHGRKRKP